VRLGIIGRADEGGLGVQTQEYARWLQPDRILVMHVDPPRGEYLYERFHGLAPIVEEVHYPLVPADRGPWRRFLEDVDVVFSAETAYGNEHEIVDRFGKKLILHANPELYQLGDDFPRVWAPTAWELHRLPPGTPVVPVPVARDRLRPTGDTHPVKVLLHVSAPAMEDRNGTEQLKAALPSCREHFDLLVAGPERPPEPTTIGNVRVQPVPPKRDYWRVYAGAQALVLPRRFGGLCLPMQEAASLELPIVALGADANAPRLAPELLVGTLDTRGVQMRGGRFDVHSCEPAQLAAVLDSLVAEPHLAQLGRFASGEWARGLDWMKWQGTYRDRLGYVADGAWAS